MNIDNDIGYVTPLICIKTYLKCSQNDTTAADESCLHEPAQCNTIEPSGSSDANSPSSKHTKQHISKINTNRKDTYCEVVDRCVDDGLCITE